MLFQKKSENKPGTWSFTLTGQVSATSVCQEAGFGVGKIIILSKVDPKKDDDKEKASITEINESNIVCKYVKSGTEFTLTVEDIQNKKWKISQADSAVEKVEHIEKILPHVSAEMDLASVKGYIMYQLKILTDRYSKESKTIDLIIKPKKIACSKVDYVVGALTLVPATISIGVKDKLPEQKSTNTFAHLGYRVIDGKKNHLIASSCYSKYDEKKTSGFAVPYWFVGFATKEKPQLANMEIAEDLSDFAIVTNPTKSLVVKIPTMRNTKAINAGDQLLLPFQDAASELKGKEEVEPQKKKQKKQ